MFKACGTGVMKNATGIGEKLYSGVSNVQAVWEDPYGCWRTTATFMWQVTLYVHNYEGHWIIVDPLKTEEIEEKKEAK